MRDDAFEWLDAKAERNLLLHDVSFEMARDVFWDPFAIEWDDRGQDEGEDRFVTVGMVEERLPFVSYTYRGPRIRIVSARLAAPPNAEGTTMKTKHDWSRADARTDAQIHEAAVADPDAQPLTPERLAGTRQTPRLKIIRRALGLTQEEFAARFQIPVGTLRDWEQGAKEQDQAARAYLRAIAGDPDAVRRALQAGPTAA